MDASKEEKVYEEIREGLLAIEEILRQMREKGRGIPFVEKNIRALGALVWAFKNGIPDPGA